MKNQHPALMLADQCDLEDTFERMCAAELIRLQAENEQLQKALLNMHDTLEMTAKSGASYAREAERLHTENEAIKAKLLNATKSALDHVQRVRDLEAMLEAVGAGGVGPLMQPQIKPLTDQAIRQLYETPEIGGSEFDWPADMAIAIVRAADAARGITEGV